MLYLDKAIEVSPEGCGSQKDRPTCYREMRRGFCRKGAKDFVFQAQLEYTTLKRGGRGKGPHQPRRQP